MRTRTRVLTSFVTVYILLSVTTGWLVWRWLDASMRAQAEASATSIGRVIARGGFALNDKVMARMRELTEHDFRVLSSPEPVRSGTVQVDEGGTIVEVDYRTNAYRQTSRQVLLGTLAVVTAGSLVFGLVALWLAAHFARPLEQLAGAARTIATGDLEPAVPGVGSGEVLELARELEHMRERLRDLDRQHRQAERLRTLGTFTATIAHEVRNPLSAVRLTVQMLFRRMPQEQSLSLITEELERLDLIVDELLGFSKGMSVRPEACDLRVIADQVVRLLARQAEHAGVSISVSGAGTASADPARMRQLLMNLLLNAIQAQHGGGATRVIVTPNGLAVEDDGPGVPPEQIPSLFEAFASGRQEGTGLGLHLARAIAEAHGASLRHVRPAVGGARFELVGLAGKGPERPEARG